jgi:hypothetical protein
MRWTRSYLTEETNYMKQKRKDAAGKLMLAVELIRDGIKDANEGAAHKSTVRKLARVELMLVRTSQALMGSRIP